MLKKMSINAVFAAFFVLLCTGVASACPTVAEGGEVLAYKAATLYSPVAHDVVAGGTVDLSACGEVPGTGYVIETPDFSMHYKSDPNYELELRTTGSCDTVLLVNDANGEWLYSDDDAGDGNALIRIASPATGRYDIWVGSYQSSTCDTELILETF